MFILFLLLTSLTAFSRRQYYLPHIHTTNIIFVRRSTPKFQNTVVVGELIEKFTPTLQFGNHTASSPYSNSTTLSPPNNISSNATTSSLIKNQSKELSNPSSQNSIYRSHINHTSEWEEYIYHYRASNTTETYYRLLFVVNYHESKYSQSDFILNEFFTHFRHRFALDFDVIILGPKADPARHVKSNHLPELGYYSYHTLAVVYNQLCEKETCHYLGFMFMNDDSYIDPQFLQRYDLTKSWSEPSSALNLKDRWMWFKKKNKNGILYKDAFANAVDELKQTEEGKKCELDNVKNQRRGWGDAFYITKKDMPQWMALIKVMKKHYVFLEQAAPTVNWCISKNFFVNCNHGRMKERMTCVHMHPVKYRQKNMKEFSIRRLYHLNLNAAPPRLY